MKQKIYFTAFVTVFAGVVSAQDVHFSQFTMPPLTLNPAKAGVQSDLGVVANSRNQWGSIENGFKTRGVSCDLSALKKSVRRAGRGAGLSILNDKRVLFN